MKSVRPILNSLRGRGLSAQAAAQQSRAAALPRQEPQVTRLPNGIIVASLENYSPVSRVAIIYNAGARYENSSNVGVTHLLRTASDLSTNGATRFAIARNIQQIGGSLTCTSTREHILYSLECTRDTLNTGYKFLANAATAPAFKDWEIPGAINALNLDLATLESQPEAQLIEGLHQAAFRNTLGRSLYANPNYAGGLNRETLLNFVKERYVAGNTAIVGVGIDHADLVQLAKKTPVPEGQAPPAEKAQYKGGEIRLDTGAPVVYAAVATEGASMSSTDLAAVWVLQQVMGTGPYVKYSSNSASRINRAAAGATSSPFAVSTINASYSDAGLFGFQVAAPAGDVGKVLQAVSGAFAEATKGGISDADVTRAKNRLKAAVQMEYESSNTVLEDIAIQAILTGQVVSLSQFESLVDKITAADVQAVAKKIINGKPSMSAVGALTDTPYLDELL